MRAIRPWDKPSPDQIKTNKDVEEAIKLYFLNWPNEVSFLEAHSNYYVETDSNPSSTLSIRLGHEYERGNFILPLEYGEPRTGVGSEIHHGIIPSITEGRAKRLYGLGGLYVLKNKGYGYNSTFVLPFDSTRQQVQFYSRPSWDARSTSWGDAGAGALVIPIENIMLGIKPSKSFLLNWLYEDPFGEVKG